MTQYDNIFKHLQTVLATQARLQDQVNTWTKSLQVPPKKNRMADQGGMQMGKGSTKNSSLLSVSIFRGPNAMVVSVFSCQNIQVFIAELRPGKIKNSVKTGIWQFSESNQDMLKS